jgi:hypothetical protein
MLKNWPHGNKFGERGGNILVSLFLYLDVDCLLQFPRFLKRKLQFKKMATTAEEANRGQCHNHYIILAIFANLWRKTGVFLKNHPIFAQFGSVLRKTQIFGEIFLIIITSVPDWTV